MAVIQLEPADFTAAQAAEILRYLNEVTSAAAIAERVEFPGEPDIGVKLGERLLRARAAFGGRYTTLAQVATVPLIGPERFTELCTALLGIDPHATVRSTLVRQDSELSDRLARLERELALLSANPRGISLEVSVAPQPAWLGQALDVTIGVRDADGEALPGSTLTVETSNGSLEGAFGFAVRRRRAFDVLSGGDGSVRLTLRGPSLEPLSPAQEAALEEALSTIDPAATSPHLLRDGFLALAERYVAEREHALRRAIDIYAREYKQAFFDQLNASNLAFDWPLQSSVLRVDCHPSRGEAQGLAQAVVVVEWKNWVGAWFEFLREFLDGRSKLGDAFRGAKQRGAKGFRLVDSLLGEAHSFVATQPGLAAEWMSQRVVKEAFGQFLGGELDDVDDGTQRELFSNLEAAAEQLTPAHRGAVAMVTQTRLDFDDRTKATDTHFSNELSALKLENQRQLDGIRGDIGGVRGEIGGIRERVTGLEGGTRTFQAELDGMRTQMRGVQNDLGTVQNKLGLVQTDLGLVQNKLGIVQTDLGVVRTELGSVKTELTGVRSNVAQVGADVSRVRADVGLVRADIGSVKGDLREVRRDVNDLRPGRNR